jgi:16S rRNA processing protein RimM
VVGRHGLKGSLRVQLRRRKRLLLGEELRPVDVAAASVSGASAIVRLVGVEDPDAAAALRGEYLYVAADEAARPRRGEYFLHEIEGLVVQTEDGRELGRVEEVLRTGANDVYVVRGPLGELLIPAIEDVVRSIDTAAGRVVVRPLPGLLPGDD